MITNFNIFESMEVEYCCYECGWKGWLYMKNIVECPNCGNINDIWKEGDLTPERHIRLNDSETYFITKKSKISGLGNFATKDINKNTNLGIGLEKVDDTGDPDKDYKRFDICVYTNHSDNPNLSYNKIDNVYYFYVLRDIDKDEEMTIDYNKFDFDGERDFIK